MILAEEPTHFRIALDDRTVARLMELSEECHADPRTLLQVIVKEFLEKREQLADLDFVTVQ